jgi:ectoine hydroxylase-related dioxygenase (phytanoyl-CoA dioxygenase family)
MKDGLMHVQPPIAVLEQMLTVRLHLDDCNSSNGPLQVIPGSHKSGRLDMERVSEWRKRGPATICSVARGGGRSAR